MQASSKYLAIPLSRPGGQIDIITIGKCGRQPSKLPAFVNGTDILDCAFSPFDASLLVAGTCGQTGTEGGQTGADKGGKGRTGADGSRRVLA